MNLDKNKNQDGILIAYIEYRVMVIRDMIEPISVNY